MQENMPDSETKLELEQFCWRGQTRYRCPSVGCHYDGPSIQEVVNHWVKLHKAEATSPAGPTLLDAKGETIIEARLHVPEALQGLFTGSSRG